MATDDTPEIRIETATRRHVPAILGLIRALADYEKLTSEVSATEADLEATLFGARPAAAALVAFAGETPVGFALYFQSYSTFLGKPGIYLEDLFVVPAFRRRGVGSQLLARIARIAVERGCGRLEWAVLDWNEPALRFYRQLGARPLEEWTVFRLTGDALATLGAED